MTDSVARMASTVLAREESDYVENILKACNEDLTIKTFAVIRETTFERLKDVIDEAVDRNPMYELAANPLNLKFLDIDKWIAVLVEYEDK